MDQRTDTGVFVDTRTNEVVYAEPEEGVQLVPPGGIIDATAKARIEAAGGTVETADVDEADETAEADKPLDKLKKDELVALAEAEGIDLGSASTNAERVEAIEAARQAS